MTPTQEAAMRQALEAMGTIGADWICEASHHAKKDQHKWGEPCPLQQRWHAAYQALHAALAEPVQEPDLSLCPNCNGPADNGHDRSIPPSPYWCTKCMAELDEFVEDETIYCPTCGEEDGGTTCGMPDCGLRCGAEPVQEPVAWALTKTLTERKTTTNGYLWFSDPVNSSWTPLYTAPPQRKPLTEGKPWRCACGANLYIDENGAPRSKA